MSIYLIQQKAQLSQRLHNAQYQGQDIVQYQITPNNWTMIATLTMADQYKAIYDLSNCAIFNDLEQP